MKRLLAVVFIVCSFCLSGCFTSVDPVFDESQVVTDPAIEGTFNNLAQDGGKLPSSWRIYRSHDFKNRYIVTIKDGPATMELVGTLFRIDGQLYLDFFPGNDGGWWNRAESGRSETEFLHHVVYAPRHLIWKIEQIASGAISYAVPTMKGLVKACSAIPELRGGSRQYAEVGIAELPRDKKTAQEYLNRLAAVPGVFDWHGKLVKVDNSK